MSEDNKVYFSIKNDIAPKDREFIPVSGLFPIKSEELIFSDELEDDRVCTDLKLSDYDWANYNLSTRFYTKENGVLRIQWNHFLMTIAVMMVTQLKDNKLTYYYIEFNSDIFGKYLKEYMIKHMEQWKPNTYAFNGEDVVIKLFNECIEKGNLCGRASTDKNIPRFLSWSIDDNEDVKIRSIIKDLNEDEEEKE